MLKQLLGCGLACAIAAGVAAAQTPAAPKPGPEHKALGYFVGQWRSEGELKPGPLGPGGTTSSTDSCEWFAAFHVVCRYTGTGPLGPALAMGIISYNAAQKAYDYYAFDNLGMNELSTGTRTANTWIFSATSHYAGQTFQSRYTIVGTSPTSYTAKWETSQDGAKWVAVFEGKATKSSKAP